MSLGYSVDNLSMGEAAKLLGVQPVTLRRWVDDGTIWAVRFTPTGHRRIPRSEVIRILREECDNARKVRKLRERL